MAKKSAASSSKGLKTKMAGGAFSDDTTTVLISVLFLLTGGILAWLLHKHIHSTSKKAVAATNSSIAVHQVSLDPEPRQVIKIITDTRDQPPIYPKRNPTYPLQRSPQGYQQVGVLVSQDSAEDKPIIMPLLGRKMSSKDRWEYYTASDEYHMWRIPVMVNNRDCQDDVGCDEIYNGDNVTVPDYANKVFVARIYKYRDPRIFSEPY